MQNIYWLNLAFIASRFYGAMWICPLFDDKMIPKLLKVLLSIIFGLILLPYIKLNSNGMNLIVVAIFMVQEILTGLFIGFIFSLPIWLIENVGNFIDMQRGEQFGAIINPMTRQQSSSIAKLLSQGFITYLIAMNGLVFFIKIIFGSFKMFPLNNKIFELGMALFSKAIIFELIKMFNQYFYWMVILALPVVLLMFLCEFGVGLFSIFAQQLNVTILVMPIKSVIAMFVLLIYLGLLYHVTIAKFTANLFSWVS
ncbi:MAG: type III secretion system export apparatus subunit SctT [Neisseriaceae bacterium]